MSAPDRSGPHPSFPFRLRLPKILSELEKAIDDARARSWEGPERERAAEVAEALSAACRMEGLREVAVMSRSLASLLQLSREQIAPIEKDYEQELREMLDFLRKQGDRAMDAG